VPFMPQHYALHRHRAIRKRPGDAHMLPVKVFPPLIVTTPAMNSSTYASASLGVIALSPNVGVIIPVICPFPSSATDFRISNSKPKLTTSPGFTTSGLARSIFTLNVVSDSWGLDCGVLSRVLRVGRVGGFVCGFATFRYPICGFASVTVTLLYVPGGMLLMSSNVLKPFNRAKSIVLVPIITDCVLLLASVTDIPVMSTWKETTLGSGASVPVTNTVPDCVCTGGVDDDPMPHPLASTASVTANSPFIHFGDT
jgi:hypothetical protein